MQRTLTLVAFVLLAAGSARASQVTLSVSATDGVTNWSDQSLIAIDVNGDFDLTGGTLLNAGFDAAADVSGNANSNVSWGVEVTNLTGSTLWFDVAINVPVSSAYSSTSTGGSLFLVLSSSDFQSLATASTGGVALFQSRLDGVAGASLFADPYSLSTMSTTTAGQSFGLPGFTVPAGALNNEIEVQMQFYLSPGDSLGLNGIFVAVPEPSSFGLAGLGLASVLACRVARRKRSVR